MPAEGASVTIPTSPALLSSTAISRVDGSGTPRGNVPVTPWRTRREPRREPSGPVGTLDRGKADVLAGVDQVRIARTKPRPVGRQQPQPVDGHLAGADLRLAAPGPGGEVAAGDAPQALPLCHPVQPRPRRRRRGRR